MNVVISYDVETIGQCVPKLGKIWKVHKQFDAPLTLFVVGRVAVNEGEDLRRLLDDGGDLFDVNSHYYSHTRVVRKIPWSRPQPSPALIEHETLRGAAAVREILDRPCRGIRAPGGVSAGFRGLTENLEPMRKANLEWGSSYARSVKTETNPAELYGPFHYGDDGYKEILELPVHGWTDCTLKSASGPNVGREGVKRQYIVGWPSDYLYPPCNVETPEEEFEVHKQALDAACDAGLPFCDLGFHPWTIVREQDADARVIELLLQYAKDEGWTVSTLDREARRCREDLSLLWPAPEVPPQRSPSFDPGTLFA